MFFFKFFFTLMARPLKMRLVLTDFCYFIIFSNGLINAINAMLDFKSDIENL